MVPISITNPRYANAEETLINCDVQFDTSQEVFPYSASASDTTEHGQAIWLALTTGAAGTIDAYEAPPPPDVPDVVMSLPCQVAGARVTIAEGDVENIVEPFNVVAAMKLDTGLYWLLFAEAIADTNYTEGGMPGFSVVEGGRQTDSITVQFADGAGVPFDPPEFTVQVWKKV